MSLLNFLLQAFGTFAQLDIKPVAVFFQRDAHGWDTFRAAACPL